MPDTLPDNTSRPLPEATREGDYTDEEILVVLRSYFDEADNARKSGPSPREQTWRNNWERYWNRFDFSNKADWQSQYVMPEAATFVDRWAASMREALVQAGDWYTVEDETGQTNELSPHIKRFMDVLLGRCALTPDGHTADFESFFEDQTKLGSLMMMCASVTWKDGWVRLESRYPLDVWLDPQGRNLYRILRYHIDKHKLVAMADRLDGAGEPLYKQEVIAQLLSDKEEEDKAERESTSGHGQGGHTTFRTPIEIKEYLCDIIMPDGEVLATNALVVVANDRYIIRGPEENPFWHERDWMVNSAMITVPTSVYGRTYAEDWADAADAFTELTNLILDGTFTSTMRAYAANSNQLKDPTQIEEGISPNKLFDLRDDVTDPRQFIREIEFGSLPPESFQTWQALKNEIREGAKQNEIALGQIPQKGGITATEASLTTQSGSAMVRSMARTIETRFLEPILTLIYFTALQHMDFTDPAVQRELGQETAAMLNRRKEEFRNRNIRFRVRGISGMIDRQSKLQNLMSMLQTMAGNEMLLQTFLQEIDLQKLVQEMFRLFGVNPLDLQLTEMEKMIRQLTQQGQPQAQPQGSSAAPTATPSQQSGNAV